MKQEVKSVRKMILITESINTELNRVAELKGISVNELINKACAAYCNRAENKWIRGNQNDRN